MENLHIKEKRLETVLEKLKNLGSSPSVHTGELDQLYAEKNQLQSEKMEIETKYNDLVLKYDELKNQLKKMQEEQKEQKKCRNSLIKI